MATKQTKMELKHDLGYILFQQEVRSLALIPFRQQDKEDLLD